jgi:hypothetical protein
MSTKTCRICKNRQPITEFYKSPNPAYKDGYLNVCKTCNLEYDRKRREKLKIVVEYKTCSRCKQTKHSSNFTSRYRNKDGLRSECKECSHKESKIYRDKKPSQRYLARIRQRYGLEEEEYNKMLDKSNGKCEICGEHVKLVVDHNHTTGKVRGLLCHSCNAAIGLFKENKDSIRNSIEYLEKYNE